MEIKIQKNQMEEIEGLRTEYPYVLHHVDLQTTVIPWHWHEELEFLYVLQGKLKIYTANESLIISQGEGMFINSNVLCKIENLEHCIVDSHLFHPIFLGGHFKSIYESKYLDPVLQNKKISILDFRGDTKSQQQLLKKLLMVSQLQKEENTEFQTRNLFSEIWLLLLEDVLQRKMQEAPLRTIEEERIQTMLSYIHEHYSEKIYLEEIAGSAGLSKSECLRCFKTTIQETPFEYLNHYRLEMVKKLLTSSNHSILEIALETGFSNSAYLGKLFREQYKITPAAYRREKQKGSSL